MSEQERNPREALEDDLTQDLELDKEFTEDVRGGCYEQLTVVIGFAQPGGPRSGASVVERP